MTTAIIVIIAAALLIAVGFALHSQIKAGIASLHEKLDADFYNLRVGINTEIDTVHTKLDSVESAVTKAVSPAPKVAPKPIAKANSKPVGKKTP